LAQEIVAKLKLTLEPHFPAAGLAAPQIGINRSIFIYSYDRNPDHLEEVINPILTPLGNEKIEGWEGCFSILLSKKNWIMAKIPRFARIQVAYFNLSGERIEKTLEGFAAKVFQHEYDHLQGILNIDRPDASLKEFKTKESLSQFLEQVKRQDKSYSF
jgi:peptide deformylase